jgi:ferritin-like metal-binding protein YciE
MKFFSENIEDLRQLYINRLQMLLSAERQIIEALPKMREAATDSQLKDALQSHLQETRMQEQRLETILNELEGECVDKKCKVTAALINAGEEAIKDAKDPVVRDASIIGSAQAVEHFEMASYGTVRSFAQILSLNHQADALEQTLQEEGHADRLLTIISNRANPQAIRIAA